MSYKPNYIKGNWKAVCDSCGRIVLASELQQRWDGFMVDSRCWEPRHPQDFVRGVADYQAPPFTRPEASDVFIPITIHLDPNGNPLFGLLTSVSNVSLQVQIIPNPLLSKKTVNGSLLLLNSTTLG